MSKLNHRNNLSIKGNVFTEQKVRGIPQPAIACSKLTIETLEQGVKYVQS